jgi:hypothetical protein
MNMIVSKNHLRSSRRGLDMAVGEKMRGGEENY